MEHNKPTPHGHAGDHAHVETNWVVIFLGAVGLFLLLYLTTLYAGHTLAG